MRAGSEYLNRPLRSLAQAQADWGKQAVTPSYSMTRGEPGSLRHTATEPHIDEPHISWFKNSGRVTFRGETLGWASLGDERRCFGIAIAYNGATLIRNDLQDIGALNNLLRFWLSERILKEAAE